MPPRVGPTIKYHAGAGVDSVKLVPPFEKGVGIAPKHLDLKHLSGGRILNHQVHRPRARLQKQSGWLSDLPMNQISHDTHGWRLALHLNALLPTNLVIG